MFLAAVVAAVATAEGTAMFFGAAGAALLGVGGAALDYGFAAVSPAGAAAVAAALALALTPLIPAAAFRLAGLTLPPVPRDADELRRDTLTVQGSQPAASCSRSHRRRRPGGHRGGLRHRPGRGRPAPCSRSAMAGCPG